jgi:hypothetical protein
MKARAVFAGLLLSIVALGFAVSPVTAASPNVGQHIHVEVSNHPVDGHPIPHAPWTFQVTIKLHDYPAVAQTYRLDRESTVIFSRPIDADPATPGNQPLGPCADCSVTFPLTVDFSASAWEGRHELHWHVDSKDSDPATSGTQRQFTSARTQVCIGNDCSPNGGNKRPTPYNGGASWYTGHDYATILLLSAETNLRPGGTIRIDPFNNANQSCVFLNPDFHHGSHGTFMDCANGTGARNVTIPADAQVGDKLAIQGSDGFNAGLEVFRLGDGTDQATATYEFQSWWAKGGLVLP